jgi:hypothetical protein
MSRTEPAPNPYPSPHFAFLSIVGAQPFACQASRPIADPDDRLQERKLRERSALLADVDRATL